MQSSTGDAVNAIRAITRCMEDINAHTSEVAHAIIRQGWQLAKFRTTLQAPQHRVRPQPQRSECCRQRRKPAPSSRLVRSPSATSQTLSMPAWSNRTGARSMSPPARKLGSSERRPITAGRTEVNRAAYPRAAGLKIFRIHPAGPKTNGNISVALLLVAFLSKLNSLTPPQKMLPMMGSGGSIILVAALVGIAGERFSTTTRLPLAVRRDFRQRHLSTRPAHRRVDDARDQRVRAYAAVLELGRPSPGVRTQRRLGGGVGRVVRQAHVVHGRG